ncbi:OmpA family protein [Methylocystis sp. WRRC1]|uniref:OmpA family protein n=1 Tax=Methylocystis sp. WRRC1 TaxID=1732014 RepID=UPI001D137B89|nr:OmpA family protein [Methylocystis sp. WRRC1]MCC3245894.1 OmpA family protein [Methylocystis sp. WRRC1]
MLDFLFHLRFWLVVCVAVGVLTGALVQYRPAKGGPARWLIWTALAFCAGAVAAALGALQGAAGVFLESALAFYATFLIGAAVGALGSGGSLAAHEGWALGLIPAGLVWWGATLFAQPAYQAELQRRVTALAAAANVDASGVGVSGRDVTAPAAIAQNPALMSQIASAPGVRRVIAAAAPIATAAIQPTAPSTPTTQAPAETPPTPTGTQAPGDPGAILAALPSGALDAAECQRALDAVAVVDRVEFREGSAAITRQAAEALDKAVALIRRCPDVTIEVRGHADDVGADDDNEALSVRRAQAVARYLRREGLGGRRVVVAGHGAHRARTAKAELDARAKFRTIDYAIQ